MITGTKDFAFWLPLDDNFTCPSQWPSGLRRRTAADRPLGLWVWIPQVAWMPVSCECCVLSCRGFGDGPIPRAEEYYGLWYVSVNVIRKTATCGGLENRRAVELWGGWVMGTGMVGVPPPCFWVRVQWIWLVFDALTTNNCKKRAFYILFTLKNSGISVRIF